MTEFLSCRPNLEAGDLAVAAAFLREVPGFEVEVDEPGMGLILPRRDAVGLALVQSATPGVNASTAAYTGVTGVGELHEQCAARGARIVAGLADHPWGLRDFAIEIPGGHRLALGERIAQPRLRHQTFIPAIRRSPCLPSFTSASRDVTSEKCGMLPDRRLCPRQALGRSIMRRAQNAQL